MSVCSDSTLDSPTLDIENDSSATATMDRAGTVLVNLDVFPAGARDLVRRLYTVPAHPCHSCQVNTLNCDFQRWNIPCVQCTELHHDCAFQHIEVFICAQSDGGHAPIFGSHPEYFFELWHANTFPGVSPEHFARWWVPSDATEQSDVPHTLLANTDTSISMAASIPREAWLFNEPGLARRPWTLQKAIDAHLTQYPPPYSHPFTTGQGFLIWGLDPSNRSDVIDSDDSDGRSTEFDFPSSASAYEELGIDPEA
ncbi:hypothetical protein C8F01DRAFT_1230756 [Mycena amicta]|nr:hypothetical protein C8F01DRAFT_1230756 [Mycena amicta]